MEDRVKEAWAAYRDKAFPDEISEVHSQIAQDAFYAGAELFADVAIVGIMPPLPDDPGWLERMQGGSLTAADVTVIEEGAGRSDQGRPFDNAPAIADDPMAAEREQYLQDT